MNVERKMFRQVRLCETTPNPAMHRTLRIKPRKAGDFER
jgi:hypothetical protein